MYMHQVPIVNLQQLEHLEAGATGLEVKGFTTTGHFMPYAAVENVKKNHLKRRLAANRLRAELDKRRTSAKH